MKNPYLSAGRDAFWKHAVAANSPFDISGLWKPKFPVTMDAPIITAGSCFAQHIGRALAGRGYHWFDAEPAPPFFDAEQAKLYNYGVFSFRTANIYTTRMLRQWLEQAHKRSKPMREVWENDEGRFFDPMRPGIEPGGFASRDELEQARKVTYASIRRAVKTARVFVFTLGLTESWANAKTGAEYASCPGTTAGSYDPEAHVFVNHRVDAIYDDLKACLALLHEVNPALRVLLTVSPVPLTATASGNHVLPATTYSKSVLRAVAGMAAEDHGWVDYFPSYEIITAPAFRGMFFEPNMRSVNPAGVDLVMKNFFADQEAAFGNAVRKKPAAKAAAKAGAGGNPRKGKPQGARGPGVLCEEEMLNAFG